MEAMQRYSTETEQNSSESEHNSSDESDEEPIIEVERKRKRSNEDDIRERTEKLEKKRLKLEEQQAKIREEQEQQQAKRREEQEQEKKLKLKMKGKKDKRMGTYTLEEIWKRLEYLEKSVTQMNERYANTSNDLDTYEGDKPLPSDTKSVYECLKRTWVPNIMKKLHDLNERMDELLKKQ